MIIGAVTPLIMEHGRAVTSRQIADAAGLAEGTIFRAFGDKESLIQAVVEKYLDPEPLRNAIRGIDPEQTLEQKVNDVVFFIRSRMTGVIGIMRALGGPGEKPPVRRGNHEYAELIAQVLEPDLHRLNVSPERVAQYLRLVSFAAAIPPLNEDYEFPTDELASLITYGIAGRPAEG